ncbi:MAG: hypothetical protein J6X44_07850 [Thermoguttaceae bacterium]|nr:hypothetical protein [Thermoguttaceae bacterium]
MTLIRNSITLLILLFCASFYVLGTVAQDRSSEDVYHQAPSPSFVQVQTKLD